MLRQISSVFALGFLTLTASCQTMSDTAGEEAWITGQVVDEKGVPIRAGLEIDGEVIDTQSDGTFAIAPTEALVYRMEFSADDHYPMRQTFSHAELQDDGDLGRITLVQRADNRTLFVFGGDAMIGRRFYDPFDGEPVLVTPENRLEDSQALLREMKPYLERADYASINLETPIFDTPPGPSAPKFVTFFSAPETLEALEWAGTDYVALGNNHIYDFLEPGLDVTLAHLSTSELDFSGAGKTEREALAAHRERLAGTDYDLLSYVGWPAGPPTQSAEDDKGGAALGTEENLVATSRQSIATGGVPVLQYHGGLEYVEEPTLSVETRVKHAIDAGAALVVAHHPHVTQGLELYQDKLIAWSLGNFLFDQYFYSAQSAALLYVWMDGDQFYHGETVPIYIKGYHPTPAVGAMRNKINRRLYELSSARNTFLQRSGGHLILRAGNTVVGVAPRFDIETDCHQGRARQGKDLLARGDFDAHALFGAKDRSWIEPAGMVRVQSEPGTDWDQAMILDIPAGETLITGMRKFQRVFTKGTPMSLRAKVESTSDVTVDAYLQIRAEGERLSDALARGRKIKLGRISVTPDMPVSIDIDFDSPRTRARSLRVLLEVTSHNAAAKVELDDLKLIEWETPFEAGLSGCSVDAAR